MNISIGNVNAVKRLESRIIDAYDWYIVGKMYIQSSDSRIVSYG